MRIAAWTLFTSLLVAAASAHISTVSEAASSSSLLLTSRNVLGSTPDNASTFETRAVVDIEVDAEEDDEEEDDGGALESRGRKKKKKVQHRNHKHSRKHKSKAKPKQKATHAAATSQAGGRYSGKGTFFMPNQGSCGQWNKPSDHIVALSADIYQGGKHCFQGVRVCHAGKCANAQVADLCPGCRKTSLDMTKSLFMELADPDEGVIDIQWSFT